MASPRRSLGSWLAPPRFLLFSAVTLIAVPVFIAATTWSTGIMIGFDLGAVTFLASYYPLIRDADPKDMRRVARDNDANRAVLLAISSFAMLAVLASVASELGGHGRPDPIVLVLVVATLILAWLFANMIYALHYAHLFYGRNDSGGDAGGLDFPETDEPVYRDFIYFAFTLGMTFQTSDTAIKTTRLRWIVTIHSMLAFVFNLGVIAFTINVLGGS